MEGNPSTAIKLDWLPEDLEGVALRLARVDQSAFEIGDLAMRWSMHPPVELRQLRRRNGEAELVVSEIHQVPPLLWLLFSEAISHLRASLDNVLWYIVSLEHEEISDSVARRVAMPIHRDAHSLSRWLKARVEDGLHVFREDGPVAKRLRELQPFATTPARIPSNNPTLAAMLGCEVEDAHPLLLLQGYSNDDKHRAIRIAVERERGGPTDQSPSDQGWFRELKVGDVVSTTRWGEPLVYESSAAALVERPSPYSALVAPATEVALLHGWVATVAVPYLVQGTPHLTGLPYQVELSDSAGSNRDRLLAGGGVSALERLRKLTTDRLTAARSATPTFPPTSHEDDEPYAR
ncbi:hypothetical protein [Arthrobacter sp. NEB 688]|uniref:hypothetical protein n=1 Tax=Arthrobacter sp. NEB 688 TaxID=904039 RepID=UPI0015649AE0|nr:hypothetical protein [Arthrobacter sp. NEB 688]QKE85151.1 hypothetical protein HL663_15205 [Arthrobacter sp. NEB 688]